MAALRAQWISGVRPQLQTDTDRLGSAEVTRYIVIAWDTCSPAEDHAAQLLARELRRKLDRAWTSVLERPGLHVHCRSDTGQALQVIKLGSDLGAIAGTLFDSQGRRCRESTFSPALSSAIAESGGSALISNYWGSYVAFLRTASKPAISILRGPASFQKCYTLTIDGVSVFFSCMFDAQAVQRRGYGIDWTHVAAHLVAPLPTGSTGLRDVSELRPGHVYQITPRGRQERVLWSTAQLAGKYETEDIDIAAERVRDVVRRCVDAWAQSHERIVLCLSGGLDSSIVLACLAESRLRREVVCLNDYSPSVDGDERSYARLAAEACKAYRLIERPRTSTFCFEQYQTWRREPSPRNYYAAIESYRSRAALAQDCGATAIFTGEGGDALFFQSHSMAHLAVADLIFRHRFRAGILRAAYNAAQLENRSLWRVLSAGLRKGLGRRDPNLLLMALPHRDLLSANLIESLRQAHRDSAREVPCIAPGSRWRADILEILPYSDDPLRQEGDADIVAPLFSQPVLELVMSLPTYVLMADGWTRGLLRRAFSSSLPREIIRRRSKGGPDDHLLRVLRDNLGFARAMLADGILVKEGLLDRTKLLAALADRRATQMEGAGEVLELLSTEVWLRSWIAPEQSSARVA